MENNNTCDGSLCSLVDKCDKEGSCNSCECYYSCVHCLFDYVPNDDNCYMNFYKVKNCKNCPYSKCSFKVDYDFDICPVEKKKQGGSNA